VAKLARADHLNTSGAVNYRLLGTSGIEIGLDYSKAPVPDHFYFADYLSVDEDSSQVMFTFGKLDKPIADQLRSKVEVYFNPLMFVKQFWASTREMHSKVKTLAMARGFAATPHSGLLQAPKVQTFQANQISMLMTEGECIADFFYLSPKDLFYKPQKNEKIDLEALVRIILSPPLVLSLLEQSQPIAEKFLLVYGEKNAIVEPK
jgi:hypothetical protein